MNKEAALSIHRNGVVMAACTYEPGTPPYVEAIAEWAVEPDFQQIVRVPVEVARNFLFKDWPGLEAAIEASK